MRMALLFVAALLIAALGALVLIRETQEPAGDQAKSAREPDAEEVAREPLVLEEPELVGHGTGMPPDPYAAADVATTLGAFRFQPPNVPPEAVARLSALARADPSLLEHLARVAMGLEAFRHGPLPKDYPYGAHAPAEWALMACPRLATPAVAALFVEHRDDKRLRIGLLHFLASFGADAEAAVPSLLETLEIEGIQPAFETYVIWTLARIGRAAAAVAPRLLAYARDPEHPLRGAAVEHLYAVAGMTPEVRALFAELIQGADYADREQAFKVILFQMEKDAESLRPVFIRLLEDEDGDICMWAAMGLGQIGVESKATVERLGRMAEEESSEAETAALGALRSAGKRGQQELLTIAKRAEYYETAVNALYHLGHTGYPVRDHPELLLTLLRDSESGVRANVVRLLATIDPRPRAGDFLAFLSAEVRAEESSLRHGALWIASNLEEGAGGGALALLIEALADDALRASAASFLGKRPRDAARIVPALRPHLEEEAAMDALGQLALEDEDARALIHHLVENGASEVVRARARSAQEALDQAAGR